MKQIETIQDFYNNIPSQKEKSLHLQNLESGHFNILPRWRCSGTYIRRDFYKLVLVIGTGILYYGNQKIMIDRPAVFITNPIIPYSWEPISQEQNGWICLFTNEFIEPEALHKQYYPLLYSKNNPVFFFNEENFLYIASLFDKMAEEISSNYAYKYCILKNQLQLLIHELQKRYPETSDSICQHDASMRVTHQFLELLRQQFPVESPERPIKLKTPQNFANRLAIHVNHLNSSVKKVTGKTSSLLISEHIIKEANALLKNSDWNIAEIAYALGFEYPSHFTTFFKKHTGLSPKNTRSQNI